MAQSGRGNRYLVTTKDIDIGSENDRWISSGELENKQRSIGYLLRSVLNSELTNPHLYPFSTSLNFTHTNTSMFTNSLFPFNEF